MTPSEPAIEAFDLMKSHGEIAILRGVSLQVSVGEVAAIIGASGCGKTTFLRCLNGLEAFQSGEIRVAGQTLSASDTIETREKTLQGIRRRVGMVFQNFNLFPHLSVLRNVTEAPIMVLGLSRDEADLRARTLLDRVGLSRHIDSRPGRLSGGQQQRVAIARTLAMNPTVILFDEPTSALDPVMAGEVRAVMADLASSGQTMVVVTHSMGFARQVARTVHFFHAGIIAESGCPDHFFQEPQTDSARLFLAEALAA